MTHGPFLWLRNLLSLIIIFYLGSNLFVFSLGFSNFTTVFLGAHLGLFILCLRIYFYFSVLNNSQPLYIQIWSIFGVPTGRMSDFSLFCVNFDSLSYCPSLSFAEVWIIYLAQSSIEQFSFQLCLICHFIYTSLLFISMTKSF